MEMEENPYLAFDGVLCIALRTEHQRIAHVRRMASELGIPVEFHFVDRSPRGGLIGCFESHIGALTLALERGYDNVLILEDDFIPSPSYDPAVIAAVGRRCRADSEWDVIKLGFGLENQPSFASAVGYMAAPRVDTLLASGSGVGSKTGAYTVRYGGILTQALIVSRRGMRKLVRAAETELAKPDSKIQHYDLWMHEVLNLDVQCVLPVQFEQAWAFPTTNSLPSGMKGVSESVLRRFQWLNSITLITYRMTFLHWYRESIALATMLAIGTAVALGVRTRRSLK